MKLVAIAFALLGIHVGPHRTIPVGYAPAWSPNAERIAYVTRGDLWVADADGSHRAAPRRAGRPARLGAERPAARVRARRLGLDGPRGRRATSGSSHAAHIPTGRPTARASPSTATARPTPRAGGTAARRRTPGIGTDPAYAPDGRLALVARRPDHRRQATSSRRAPSPDWSADGRLAWVRDGMIYVAGRQYHRGSQPAWPPARRVARAPARLRPARADRARDRRRRRALACSASRRSSTTSAPAARCSSAFDARAAAHDRDAARQARERRDPRLPQRRAVPLHELAPAPPLAPDAVRLVRAAHARRTHARARPQERLLPRRPLGRRAGQLPRPPPGLPRRLRPVPSRRRRTC